MVLFLDNYLHTKILRYRLILSSDIYGQGILLSNCKKRHIYNPGQNIWHFTAFQCKFDSPQIKQGLITNIINFV